MEKFRKYLLFVLFLILSITVSYHHGKIQGLQEYYNEINKLKSTEETYTHTISDVIFDTVFIDNYIPYYETDTVLLTDTITDTLIVIDSVYLPNQIGIVDSTFTDTVDNQILSNQLHIQISGYEPSLDSLCLKTTIKQHATRKKWFEYLTPAIGVGVGFNGKIGLFAGVGYRF